MPLNKQTKHTTLQRTARTSVSGEAGTRVCTVLLLFSQFQFGGYAALYVKVPSSKGL